ncbi:MAG TPA: BTAD domain-containing putative transcriptional regulator [Acidimicrobiales bacterium]|nr:BTAD domain-containing putative transcriptional regulator [Acidimicrobiales bacterium]
MVSGIGRGRYEPPVGGRALLVRSRLLDGLRRRFTVPVVVVAAPAGFGKTTLLAQAWDDNRLAPVGDDVWVTCRPEDAAASSLVAGICRALGCDPPGAGSTAPEAVDVIADAVWHRSPRAVALLLDDVHVVAPESSGAAVLAALLDRLPRNGHLVLSGRSAAPVALARAEVQGDVLRLSEAELSFTDGELAEFAVRRGVPLGPLASCGGWPAFAELTATASAAGGTDEVEDAYVWEEVLSGLAVDHRHQLALLAQLGDFDDELAAAALGCDVDVGRLTADLPLVSRTAGGTWSIHALYRSFLADGVDPDDVAAARRRAGLALASEGDTVAAVALLADAAAWDDVTRVVVEALGAARPPVPGDVVATWLERLPAERHTGAVAQLLGAVASIPSDPEAAEAGFSRAMARFRETGDVTGELACITQLAQLAWWWEQPERMVAVAQRLFELDASGYEPAAALACVGRALVADLANDSERTLAELDRIPAGAFNWQWTRLVDWVRSLSWSHLGRPEEALVAADRAVEGSAPLHAPLFEAARLQARWFLGQVDEVVQRFGPLVERYSAAGHGNYQALGSATCCLALAFVGRPDEAAPYLERARHSATSREVPLVDVNLTVAEAALLVARGDEPAASALLEDYFDRFGLLGPGHAAAPQQRSLALWYVLVPATRGVWDAAPLGPAFAQAHALARALVEVRVAAGARADARAAAVLREVSTGAVRAHLPLVWAVELALAGLREGEAAANDLMDALWPAAQPVVRRLAEEDAPGGRPEVARSARTALGRLPVPPSGRLELRLLGPVDLRRDGRLVDSPDWRRERVRSLLAHLALERPVSRERLAADLWPTLDVEAQSRNLRVTLSYLLRVLEPDRVDRDASFLVRTHGGGLVLEGGDHLHVDLWDFDAHHAEATAADRRGAPSLALGPMRAAVALWRGDPTELAGEEWALPEVEQRRQRLVAMACRAGELLLARGEPDEAEELAAAALQADIWSERGHHVSVAAHVARRDDRGVRAALDRYDTALVDLGLVAADRASRLRELAAAAGVDALRI